MYEEIIDLPARYGLLDSHYKAEHAEFDRKLLAYIGSQISTRGMLHQAMSDYGQGNGSLGHAEPGTTQGLRTTPSAHSVDYLPQQYQQQYLHHKQLAQFQEHNDQRLAASNYPHEMPSNPNRPHSSNNEYHFQSRSQGSPASVSTPLGAAPCWNYDCHAQSQAPSATVPHYNGLVMPDQNNPQKFALQDQTPRAANSQSPIDLTRNDSAIDMANDQLSSQQFAWSAAYQLPPRRHTAPFPLSTTLPPETQQILTSSPVESAYASTLPSPQTNSPARKYSYKPNRGPMSSRNDQAHPASMPIMPSYQQWYHSAPWAFNAGLEQGEFPSYSARDITVPPTRLHNDGMGLEATLAPNPLMSSNQPSGSKDDRTKK